MIDSAFGLGLFSPNCEGGLAITTAPERWRATWPNNVALGRLADERGIDFILPIGRWKGWGGASDFHGQTLETLTWASAMLASTERITILATVHAPMLHPVVAAKQAATASHVGAGRFGLNVVCGWNADEVAMFGQSQLEHDERYVYGQEWLDVVRLVWRSEQPVDHVGPYFDLPGLVSRPGPYGDREPTLVNAGFSPAGRAFAARNCDYLFLSLVDVARATEDTRAIKSQAAGLGRSVGVIGTAWVVCRPTEAEAREYLHHYAVEHADWEAADALMSAMGLAPGSNFPEGHYERFRDRFVAGHGGYPLVGTPDQIADELERISRAGIDAVAFGLVDYLGELPYFCDEVVPRLERRGLRAPLAQQD